MSLGFTEIMLISVCILILFGSQRIPELAKALGRAQYEFTKAKASIAKEGEDLIHSTSTTETTAQNGNQTDGQQ